MLRRRHRLRRVRRVRVFAHATSLGGVESTIERRAKPPGQTMFPPGLVRLSVCCEHLEDLWADLAAALDVAAAADPRHTEIGSER